MLTHRLAARTSWSATACLVLVLFLGVGFGFAAVAGWPKVRLSVEWPRTGVQQQQSLPRPPEAHAQHEASAQTTTTTTTTQSQSQAQHLLAVQWEDVDEHRDGGNPSDAATETEADDSTIATAFFFNITGGAPRNEPPSAQARELLALGSPLVDGWKPNSWNISQSEMNAVLARVGDRSRKCDRGNEHVHIRMTMTSSGFGSNLLQMYNSLLFAVTVKKQFLLIRNFASKLAIEYFRDFAYPVSGWTVCAEPLAIACPPHYANCRTKEKYKSTMIKLRRNAPDFFQGMKVEMMRLFTRVNDTLRRDVDAKLDAFLRTKAGTTLRDFTARSSSSSPAEKTLLSVALHVRGGDKLFAESVPVSGDKYANAILRTLKLERHPIWNARARIGSIFVVTDDLDYYLNHISPNLHRTKELAGVKYYVHFIDDENRPDFQISNQDSVLRNSVVDMMMDLKLTQITDVFVGTRSSNFGDVACILRGGTECYDAENWPESFEWNHASEKLY